MMLIGNFRGLSSPLKTARRTTFGMNLCVILVLLILSSVGVYVRAESETITVKSFESVTTSLPGKVVVKPGDEYSVTFTADPAVLPALSASVSGKTLRLEAKKSFTTDKAITAEVTMSETGLKSLSTSSAGDIYLEEGFDVKSLTLESSSAGNVYVEGVDLEDATLISTSAGYIFLSKTKNAKVTASSAGDIYLEASGTVTVDLSSVGSVKVEGSPTTTITGSASSIGAVQYTDGSCTVDSDTDIFGPKCEQISGFSVADTIPTLPNIP